MKLSKQVPLNALRVFEAVARHGSFTRTGAELGMTQTAVSYQIKLLEENIGEPLFLRRPRQITLTDVGEQLAPKVAEAFGMLNEAMAEARGDTQTMLTISSVPTFAANWLARRLGSFQLAHPSMAVRLDTSDTMFDLAREAIDVGIRSGQGEWPGIRAELLLKTTFTPMLSPRLAESIGGVHRPEDLLKLRIIDPGDPWWEQWFEAAGVRKHDLATRTRSRLGSQSIEATAAMAGQGVAILTPAFFAEEIAYGRLYQPFELMCDDGRGYWLAYPEGRRNVAKIKAFRAWIVEEMRAENASRKSTQKSISGA
ncbi:LysR substrate-binding domain-containing protein [Rhizobium tubonense]|uniref:HTH-type transcriptional regulator TtuA n=1 Tax=Rhizobium tubonense TaxID=484088 RepID=A0A2W4D9W5_9HYPH|nr:LysR substrate-binding domain-containing protein [Rhizobium tubonense]PZM13884.1 LysR family transcriptional regulator [Rhizobium tubonense]